MIPYRTNTTVENCVAQFQSFFVSKNIPLDVRFVISGINKIESEILPEHRYPGLIFFSINENELYYFDNDYLAIPLVRAVSNNLIYSIRGYNDLVRPDTPIKTGQIVYDTNTGANLQKTEDGFRYISGTIKVPTVEAFNNLPPQLKPDNGRVEIGSTVYSITKQKTLEPVSRIYNGVDEISNPIEGKVYKTVDGYKLFTEQGEWIDMGSNVHVEPLFIRAGENSINNPFTIAPSKIEAYQGFTPLYFDYRIVGNQIKFESRTYLDNCKIKITK